MGRLPKRQDTVRPQQAVKREKEVERLNRELAPAGWMGGGLTDLTQHLHKSTPNSGTALTAADLARAENIDYECAKAFCMIYGFRMMRLWCIKHNDFRKYQCDGTIDEFVMEWMKKEGWQIDGVCDTRRTQT